jgi:hypothetical protein
MRWKKPSVLLKSGITTSAAIDNIDHNHNPSSTSAHDSFHGTGISLFQHPDDAFTGVQRNVATIPGDTQEVPRERQLNFQTHTPMCPLLLRSDRFLPYHCSMDPTKS